MENSSLPVLSVVIPTHARPEILRTTLAHLAAQTIAAKIEVIVVDDASIVQVEKMVGEISGIETQYVAVSPCHQGTARNRGVEKARGSIVMFIGDDIFLAPDACERHVNAHAQCYGERRRAMTPPTSPFVSAQGDTCAVLGFSTWDPACGITRVMQWLEKSGWQFGYPMIAPYANGIIPAAMQHRFTYTSHISLPTEVARKIAFREDVTLYGWEDVEWGWRLRNAGLPLLYVPDEKELHHHHMEVEDSLRRMKTLGASAVKMEEIAPALRLVPRGWKRLKYTVTSILPGMRGMHTRAFLRGISSSHRLR